MKVLSADIGGTNARFAMAKMTPDGIAWLDRRVFSSQKASFEAALREIIRTWDEIDDVRAVVIAAAGPVELAAVGALFRGQLQDMVNNGGGDA